MPIYLYRCTEGHEFQQTHSMKDVPDQARCPRCKRAGYKIFMPPHTHTETGRKS